MQQRRAKTHLRTHRRPVREFYFRGCHLVGLVVDYCLFRAVLVQSHQVQTKSLSLFRCPKTPDLLGHEWDKISGRSKLPLPFTEPVFTSAHFWNARGDSWMLFTSGCRAIGRPHKINLKTCSRWRRKTAPGATRTKSVRRSSAVFSRSNSAGVTGRPGPYIACGPKLQANSPSNAYTWSKENPASAAPDRGRYSSE